MDEYIRVYSGSLTRDLAEELRHRLDTTEVSSLFVSNLPQKECISHIRNELATRIGEYTTTLYSKPKYLAEKYGSPNYNVPDSQFWVERRTYTHHAPISHYKCVQRDCVTLQLIWNLENTPITVYIRGKQRFHLEQGDVILFPMNWTHPYHIEPDNAAVLLAIAVSE